MSMILGEKFYSKYNPEDVYLLLDYGPDRLFYTNILIKPPENIPVVIYYDYMLQIGWEEKDYIQAIIFWKNNVHKMKYYLDNEKSNLIYCLKNLEENLDQYLNEANIKSIIE